jgi:hypothetical protein
VTESAEKDSAYSALPCFRDLYIQRGDGKNHLSSFLLTLNLSAFLFYTVLELVDEKYQLLREELSARRTFFNDVRALLRYLLFESWEHLLDFMIEQLEVVVPYDTS